MIWKMRIENIIIFIGLLRGIVGIQYIILIFMLLIIYELNSSEIDDYLYYYERKYNTLLNLQC
jgi:hypothetical protein